MWTHHNPYTSDKRFHQTAPTEEDRIVAREYFKEKQKRAQKQKNILTSDKYQNICTSI
jgi:hypothetical protein